MEEYRAAYEKETREAGERMLAEMKELLVREGEPARAHGCDTIVVGRRGKSMVGQFLVGSAVEHLLRNPTGFTIWVVG